MNNDSDLTFIPFTVALILAVLVTLAAFFLVGVVVGLIVLVVFVVIGILFLLRFIKRNDLSQPAAEGSDGSGRSDA